MARRSRAGGPRRALDDDHPPAVGTERPHVPPRRRPGNRSASEPDLGDLTPSRPPWPRRRNPNATTWIAATTTSAAAKAAASGHVLSERWSTARKATVP